MRSLFTKITFLMILVSIFCNAQSANALFNKAKVTVLVVDESRSPLEGVDVGIGFEKNKSGGTATKAVRGVTGPDGRFTASGMCNGHIGYGGRKSGYYRSSYSYDFKDIDFLKWKPWNPELIIVMRKIDNPVPMYARKAKLDIPIKNKDVGFDLVAYDWVAPYGRGSYSDFIFNLTEEFINRDDFRAQLNLRFNHESDGIVRVSEDLSNGSQYKLPKKAPNNGYSENFTFSRSMSPNSSQDKSYRQSDNFIFRVRSRVVDGEYESSMHGKIYGPISFDPRKDPTRVYFKYYLNPDYTRNLEFDPEQNLFGDLPRRERVGIK